MKIANENIVGLVKRYQTVSGFSEREATFAVIGFGALNLKALIQFFVDTGIGPGELGHHGVAKVIVSVCRCTERVAYFGLMELGYGSICRLVAYYREEEGSSND